MNNGNEGLQVTKLDKTYPCGIRALDNVDLRVEPGLCGLLGPAHLPDEPHAGATGPVRRNPESSLPAMRRCRSPSRLTALVLSVGLASCGPGGPADPGTVEGDPLKMPYQPVDEVGSLQAAWGRAAEPQGAKPIWPSRGRSDAPRGP